MKIKSKCAIQVTRQGEKTNAYRILVEKTKENNLEDLDVDGKIILKLILTRIEGCGSDPSGSGDGPAMGSCEYDNEPLDSTK